MSIEEKQLVQALLTLRMKLLGYLATIVRDEHSAEDVYQQVAMMAVENRQEFESIDHLKSWLFCTAKHRGIDHLRKACRKDISLDEQLASSVCARYESLNESDLEDSLRRLRSCIRGLAPSAAHLLGLRYSEGLSGKAIATRLDRSRNAVDLAMCRIRRALAKCIRERAIAEEGPS